MQVEKRCKECKCSLTQCHSIQNNCVIQVTYFSLKSKKSGQEGCILIVYLRVISELKKTPHPSKKDLKSIKLIETAKNVMWVFCPGAQNK